MTQERCVNALSIRQFTCASFLTGNVVPLFVSLCLEVAKKTKNTPTTDTTTHSSAKLVEVSSVSKEEIRLLLSHKH